MRLHLAVVLIVASALAGGSPRSAETGDDAAKRLERVEKELEASRGRKDASERRAQELGGELGELRQALIAAAGEAQQREDEIAQYEDRIAHLSELERELLNQLDRRRAETAGTLGALQRLARRPPEALVLADGTAVDVVRTAMLLKAVVPALAADAETLRGELAELAELRAEVEAERARLGAAVQALDRQQLVLARLFERKTREQAASQQQTQVEAKRVAALAAQSGDLRALVARLESARIAPPRERDFVLPKGALPLPVRGQITRRFGQTNDVGHVERGMSIAARTGGQVVAPFDGEVQFAGPFRGFGLVLILAHADAYHSLMAGLGRIDVEPGQSLLSGEPVGVMPSESGKAPVLYLELRRQGDPVNPLPWLASGKRKVGG
ncbi:MAG: hypothetical protein FJX46_05070 [Alphaproteobacteria bacterium]|nr:hypothetical protein [Alphaproteobacteria bacterium]